MASQTQPSEKSPSSGAVAEGEHDLAMLSGCQVEQLRWLAQLRWAAIACTALTLTACWRMGFLEFHTPLFAIPVVMCFYNLAFRRWARSVSDETPPDRLSRAAFYQQLLDVVALTLMLHWAGGAGNPFVTLFAFHIAIGAILLPLRMVLILGAATCLFHGGAVLAEALELLQSHPLSFGVPEFSASLSGAARPLPWLAGYVMAFVVMVFGIIYFVRTIVVRHWAVQELSWEREQIAVSRERMARVGEISAGVAHTVRNPLHGLLNCVDLIRRRMPPDGDTEDLLDLMLEGLARIDIVTQRLLHLSRDDGLQKTPADICALVRDMVPFVESRDRKKTVPLRLQLEETPEIRVDPARFSEALINVVHNAMDACEADAEVSVGVYEGKPPRPGVWIEVTDTGPGIPEADLARVFDPFFTTKPVGEGTGLGLAIAKRIIEEHGGEITVESRFGEGTCVRFFLPAEGGALSLRSATGATEQSSRGPRGATSSGSSTTLAASH